MQHRHPAWKSASATRLWRSCCRCSAARYGTCIRKKYYRSLGVPGTPETRGTPTRVPVRSQYGPYIAYRLYNDSCIISIQGIHNSLTARVGYATLHQRTKHPCLIPPTQPYYALDRSLGCSRHNNPPRVPYGRAGPSRPNHPSARCTVPTLHRPSRASDRRHRARPPRASADRILDWSNRHYSSIDEHQQTNPP